MKDHNKKVHKDEPTVPDNQELPQGRKMEMRHPVFARVVLGVDLWVSGAGCQQNAQRILVEH